MLPIPPRCDAAATWRRVAGVVTSVHGFADPFTVGLFADLALGPSSGLTEERLRNCARLLANARRDAIALASYEMGDDPWSVGCRAFAFGRHRLRRTAEAGTYLWLRLLDESHHFVFLIEQVPVRFYRGLADEPTARTLRRREVEAERLSLALGKDQAGHGLVFRFAIETKPIGAVERIVFLALRGEDRTECFRPVPLDVSADQRVITSSTQLRLLADDGYSGPGRPDVKPMPV